MNHHYRPYIPPYHPPTPPPPPPPPPPPEVLQDEAATGAPRCYFCGQVIAENEVRKTEYDVGHGHKIFVMICPECQGKKERGEGPFAWQISGETAWGICMVIVVAIFFLVFWLPGFLDMQQKHKEFERGNQEFRKKIDEDWNKRPAGF